MSVGLNPYVNFRDTTREAMTFYEMVFGGELTFMTFAEGGMSQDASDADLIMHGQLVSAAGYWLMGADVPASMPLDSGGGISVSLSGDSDSADELTGYWNKLSDGATITAPLNKAPWGDIFGMCTDRFGVSWLVNISGS